MRFQVAETEGLLPMLGDQIQVGAP